MFAVYQHDDFEHASKAVAVGRFRSIADARHFVIASSRIAWALQRIHLGSTSGMEFDPMLSWSVTDEETGARIFETWTKPRMAIMTTAPTELDLYLVMDSRLQRGYDAPGLSDLQEIERVMDLSRSSGATS